MQRPRSPKAVDIEMVALRIIVAAIAIDQAGHRLCAVADVERDDERAAVVDEMRLDVAVPDDNVPMAAARSSSVGQIGVRRTVAQ
jgi:hypothetical protein